MPLILSLYYNTQRTVVRYKFVKIRLNIKLNIFLEYHQIKLIYSCWVCKKEFVIL